MVADETWLGDRERWLYTFLAALSHPARRRMCHLYGTGLIVPGERKRLARPLRLLGPGQQLLDHVDFVVREACKSVSELGLRVDTVELGCLDQEVGDGGRFAACLQADEQVLLPAERNGVHAAPGRVVVHSEGAALQIARWAARGVAPG